MTQFTEQDTYEALRRTPRHQLEKDQQGWACSMIRRTEWHRCREELILQQEIKKARFFAKFQFIFGPREIIAIRTVPDRSMLKTFDEVFKGTGWTAVQYGEEVYKEALGVITHNEMMNREKDRLVLLTYLCITLSTLVASIVLSSILMQVLAPIAIGFIGGSIAWKIKGIYSQKLLEENVSI